MSKISSMKLIGMDNNKNLVIDHKALDIIRSLEGDIAVCVVIGQYRSGKSFLMSNILRKLTGSDENIFEVGHKEDSFTKGCWMNTKISKLKNKHSINGQNILFIDTEGIESESNDESWETKLFLFSLLISSMFLYNTKNSLSAADFKKLAVMSNLSEKLRLRSNSSQIENERRLREEGPDFLCIVRDFQLKGDEYSADESLNRFLEMEKKENLSDKEDKKSSLEDPIAKRNQIRKNMINSFKSLKSFRLATPVSDDTVEDQSMEQSLQCLDSINFNQLREYFQKDFTSMTEWVKGNLKPKEINSTNLNGSTLANFIKIIVDLINNDKVIQLYDTLLSAIKVEADHTLELIKNDYRNQMDSKMFPIRINDFDELENEISQSLINKLKTQMAPNESLVVEYKQKFDAFHSDKRQFYIDENSKRINEFNKKKTIEFWDSEYRTKSFIISSLKTIIELNNCVNDFKSRFINQKQYQSNSGLDESFFLSDLNDIGIETIRSDVADKERQERDRVLKEEHEKNLKLELDSVNRSNCGYSHQYSSSPSVQFERCAPLKSHSGPPGLTFVGYYESKGSANEQPMYKTERGATLRINGNNGKKTYVYGKNKR